MLRRDIIVGETADIVYAISWLDNVNDKLIVHGGTAWAFYMSIDIRIKYIIDNIPHVIDVRLPCYLFDQNIKKWYQVNYNMPTGSISFLIVDKVPLIKDLGINIKFAGIGTRELNDSGIEAIKKLYE